MGNVKEKEKFMTFKEALEVVKMFSRSQGFYGRLLEQMLELDRAEQKAFEQDLADNNVKTDLDLIYYFEC